MSFADIGGVIGSIWGPIGAAIGSTIGSLIDMQFMDDIEGPRLQDIKFTTSAYGAPIPLVYGPSNRVAGQVIWWDGVTEAKREEDTGAFGLGPTITTYTYFSSIAIAFNDRPSSQLKRIWANNVVIFDASAKDPDVPTPTMSPTRGQKFVRVYNPITGEDVIFENGIPDDIPPTFKGIFSYLRSFKPTGYMSEMEYVRFYPGSETQEPDLFMESVEGVGNVPAYKGVSYIVINRLALASFGNRIPNIEVEVEADEEISLDGMMQDLLGRAGISDTSSISLTDSVSGAFFARNAALTAFLPQLQTFFRFHTVQQFGSIRFIKRPESMQGTIGLTDMGGRERSTEPAQNGPIVYNIESEAESINSVALTALDIGRDYQRNTQKAFRSVGRAGNEVALEMALSLTATEIRETAERILKDAWSRQWRLRFSTSSAYANLAAGYTLGVPYNDEVLPILITQVTIGRNGIVEVEGTFEDTSTEAVSVIAQPAPVSSVNRTLAVLTTLQLLDIPLILTGNEDSGFYWAISANNFFTGASLQRSIVAYDSDYLNIAEAGQQSYIGDVATALAAGTDVTFDRTNTLTVTLRNPSLMLSSQTELAVLNGANLAWVGPESGIGGELIQFVDATLVSSGVYTLSTLLRGRYGTEANIGTHGADEVFVLITTATIGSLDFGTADWNLTRWYRALVSGQDDSVTYLYEFANTGVRAKPLSPVHIKGSRDGSNDLTISWIRRSRGTRTYLGGGTVPLNEVTESYEVDIMSGVSVLRTISISSESATYTAAQQTTDGLTPGDLVDVNIYQISDTRGRGFPGSATV